MLPSQTRRAFVALLAAVTMLCWPAATFAQTPEAATAKPQISTAQAPALARATTAVDRAARDLSRARADVDATSTHLDDVAGMYERANAAASRLAGEALDNDGDLAAAEAAVVDAGVQLQAEVVAVYKHPMGARTASLADAVFGAPDAATALHRAALAKALAGRAAADILQAEVDQALVVDEVTAERVVAAGTTGALQQLRRTSALLTAELESAKTNVDVAEEALRDARADAAAAAQPAVTATTTAQSSLAPVDVNGRFCPVGAPNGFIDSWGFPRSGGRSHQGVDMFAAYGMPLYAIADGTVRVSSNSLGGLTVNLDEPNGDYYYYAHLSSVDVVDGQAVRAGDVLGAVGTSGNAVGTPPHLHWEVHPGGGSAVNPYPLAAALCR